MGSGSKKTTSTSTFTPDKNVAAGAQSALSMARSYAAKPWEQYTGDRVAGATGNETQAYNLASQWAGKGASALEGIEKFPAADMQAYMNPYIKGALDPAARELSLAGAQRRNQIAEQAQSVGAFSGSRQILREREADKGLEQSLSDLYGRGYSEAFDRGAALWSADQDRVIQAAGLGSDLIDKDISRLMSTGLNARQIDQMQKDFDYNQFVEKRDWSGKNAAYLTDVLRGLKGSVGESTTTKTKSKESGNIAGQLLGAAVTIGAAYFTGGASLAAGVGSSYASSAGQTANA